MYTHWNNELCLKAQLCNNFQCLKRADCHLMMPRFYCFTTTEHLWGSGNDPIFCDNYYHPSAQLMQHKNASEREAVSCLACWNTWKLHLGWFSSEKSGRCGSGCSGAELFRSEAAAAAAAAARPLCGRQQGNASLTAQGSEALCCSFIWRHHDRREKATGDNADRAALSPRRRLFEEPCWFLQSDTKELLWPRNSHWRCRMNLRERAGSFF